MLFWQHTASIRSLFHGNWLPESETRVKKVGQKWMSANIDDCEYYTEIIIVPLKEPIGGTNLFRKQTYYC